MSIYSVKRKIKGKLRVIGYRYDFVMNGERYQSKIFKTKEEAIRAEQKLKESILKPLQSTTDTLFYDLVDKWISEQKAYRGERHYKDCCYLARRWLERWSNLQCKEITQQMIKEFIFERGLGREDSLKKPHTANKEIKFLRAVFNFGKSQNPPLVQINPADGIRFFPVNKHVKYIPPKEDIIKVIWLADQDVRDYLYSLWDTKGRMTEVNLLTWNDVFLCLDDMDPWKKSHVVLYTRKKRDGSRTPRKIPLTKRLYEILLRRYKERDKRKLWVFWHSWFDNKTGEKKEGPFIDRPKIMKTLCRKAGVPYFRFHALRHSGASIMADNPNVTIGSVQRILGHESQKTTEIYLHSISDSERAAMEAFEQASEGEKREEENHNE